MGQYGQWLYHREVDQQLRLTTGPYCARTARLTRAKAQFIEDNCLQHRSSILRALRCNKAPNCTPRAPSPLSSTQEHLSLANKEYLHKASHQPLFAWVIFPTSILRGQTYPVKIDAHGQRQREHQFPQRNKSLASRYDCLY